MRLDIPVDLDLHLPPATGKYRSSTEIVGRNYLLAAVLAQPSQPLSIQALRGLANPPQGSPWVKNCLLRRTDFQYKKQPPDPKVQFPADLRYWPACTRHLDVQREWPLEDAVHIARVQRPVFEFPPDGPAAWGLGSPRTGKGAKPSPPSGRGAAAASTASTGPADSPLPFSTSKWRKTGDDPQQATPGDQWEGWQTGWGAQQGGRWVGQDWQQSPVSNLPPPAPGKGAPTSKAAWGVGPPHPSSDQGEREGRQRTA